MKLTIPVSLGAYAGMILLNSPEIFDPADLRTRLDALVAKAVVEGEPKPTGLMNSSKSWRRQCLSRLHGRP